MIKGIGVSLLCHVTFIAAHIGAKVLAVTPLLVDINIAFTMTSHTLLALLRKILWDIDRCHSICPCGGYKEKKSYPTRTIFFSLLFLLIPV
jgi:hypothetical protein